VDFGDGGAATVATRPGRTQSSNRFGPEADPGAEGSVALVSHRFAAAGSYIVTARHTDDYGVSAVAQVQVHVDG
jgi:hypothetical protein